MIPNNKTSILIPSQLPEFISEDVNYGNFVAFLKAYYEWMENSGTITNINIVNGGLGYSNVSVNIVGDGSGATAQASLSSKGIINEIIITSYGSGYTYANVVINGTSIIPATATAVIKNGPINDSKQLLNYMDVDQTTNQFLDYFINDFLPYFPSDALSSKQKALKIAKQLYKSKGTPASYEFLFRVLYNSSFDYYNTGDLALKASAGNWYVPKSLAILSTDVRFLQTKNYQVFGETSKSFATIENAVLGTDKIELFISNIERLFQSGEYVRIVDSNGTDVIIDGSNLRSRIIGQISSINVNSKYKGLNYKSGNPVIIYGGLSNQVANPVGASAVVGDTTAGGLSHISLLSGGQGYNLTRTSEPSTQLIFIPNGPTAGVIQPTAQVVAVDTGNGFTVNNIPTDTIGYKLQKTLNANNFYFANGTVITIDSANSFAVGETVYQGNISNPTFFGTVNYYTANTNIIKVSSVGPFVNSSINVGGLLTGETSGASANALSIYTANLNSRMEDVFNTTSFTGYPISSVFLSSSGSNITVLPTLQAQSQYATDNPATYGVISNLGILGPVIIANGGTGYRVNDTVVFSGGSGYGANATVTQVGSNGAITSITYNSVNGLPTGGVGYNNSLPALTVVSANNLASNASLYVNGTMGTGATFNEISSQIGQILNINLLNYGADYVTAPSVSLKVQDIAVTGITSSTIPKPFDTVYQGASQNASSYVATVYQVTQLGPTNSNPLNTIYRVRVFNYSNDPNPSLPLVSSTTGYNYTPIGYAYDSTWNNQGFIDYGDGTAQATAQFLNGLVFGAGQYLSSSGQLSSYDVLQSQDYNSYTYKITTEKEISKYRSILLNLLHPSGTQLLGRYSTTKLSLDNFVQQNALKKAYNLYHYTGAAASNVSMTTSLSQTWSNTVVFNNLPTGTNIAGFIFANSSTIAIQTSNGPNVVSLVTSVDYANNKVSIQDKTFLTYANTFYVNYTANSNTVTVLSPTGLYNYDDQYGYNYSPERNDWAAPSSTVMPLNTLLFAGDTVYLDQNHAVTVSTIDYTNGIIYLNTTANVNISNSPITIVRNFVAGGSVSNANQVKIYGPSGLQYFPQLTDEAGDNFITEDGQFILLG